VARRGSELLTGPAPTAERAVIGDELRELAAWCQIGACIARHTDRGALGEADIRNKAVAAGWCVDLFGRLICPSCQQIYAVWSARPLVRADRAGDLAGRRDEMEVLDVVRKFRGRIAGGDAVDAIDVHRSGLPEDGLRPLARAFRKGDWRSG
jgi:hypothetical protein